MQPTTHNIIQDGGTPIRLWTKGVPVDPKAHDQLIKASKMPFVYKWLAVMPDVHVGIGATIGTVLPTKEAIIPAAVGVDIGCGMMAVQTTLTANDLPDSLLGLRTELEKAIPHGRSKTRGRGSRRDVGAWANPDDTVMNGWGTLVDDFDYITQKHPKLKNTNNLNHLGTLGTGNHFVEVCLDETNQVGSCCTQAHAVWVMPSVAILLSWHVKTCANGSSTCLIKIWPTLPRVQSISMTIGLPSVGRNVLPLKTVKS